MTDTATATRAGIQIKAAVRTFLVPGRCRHGTLVLGAPRLPYRRDISKAGALRLRELATRWGGNHVAVIGWLREAESLETSTGP
jgi:hypothetical protein